MDVNQWTPLLHELGTIIAATAAAIAAVSSLKNGRTLNGHIKPKVEKLVEKKTKRIGKNGKHEDWYRDPDVM
jgi:hypothetical protein